MIDADVRHAVEKTALQGERQVGGGGKADALAAPERQDEHRPPGDREAQRDAEFRRKVRELVGDLAGVDSAGRDEVAGVLDPHARAGHGEHPDALERGD